MPHANSGGTRLFFEESGSGEPIVFVHEFAGDHRSWAPQVRFFSRRYRCVTYNARGYPPSDVPTDLAAYSQKQACDDIAAVMRHLGIARAHVVGLSMGGFATLHFGLNYPEMARSLVVAGCGYGAKPSERPQFAADSEELARRFDAEGGAAVGRTYAEATFRLPFKHKDPLGWAEFRDHLMEHDARGAANTLRGVQKVRPSLWDLEPQLKALQVPTLVVNGDEDEYCLEPGLFLIRHITTAGLWIMPRTGHTLNLEEPGMFNAGIAEFFAQVEAGRWGVRATAGGAASAMLPDTGR